MRRRPTKPLVTATFDIVRTVGLALPDVEATTKYDGSPSARLAVRVMAHDDDEGAKTSAAADILRIDPPRRRRA
jgi:hypothetical protein